MGEKLIHIPPQQLDPLLRDWLEGRGKSGYKTKREHKIVDPIGLDFCKETKQLPQAEDWDDNKQHTENWL